MLFVIYSAGGHLDHMTWIIYIKFHPPFLYRLPITFGFDWPTSFREDL